MKLDRLSERFRAIEKLQSIRDCPNTHPYTSEVADYAIGLTLSPARKIGPYLVEDTMRDARRILARTKARNEARFVSLDAEIPGDDEESESTWHDIVPSTARTPAQACDAADHKRQIFAGLEPTAITYRLVNALDRGEPLAAAAIANGISLSYAKKLRKNFTNKFRHSGLN